MFIVYNNYLNFELSVRTGPITIAIVKCKTKSNLRKGLANKWHALLNRIEKKIVHKVNIESKDVVNKKKAKALHYNVLYLEDKLINMINYNYEH